MLISLKIANFAALSHNSQRYMNKLILTLTLLLTTLACWSRDIVPFTINPSTNQMEVEVFVNNDSVPFNFVLDTGASAVFANSNSERLVKLLNLCDTDTIENAYSTTIAYKTPHDNQLMMGSLICDSIQIYCDTDPNAQYDGIIGLSLLKKFKLGILPSSGMMIFCNYEEPLRFPDSVELPLISGNGVLGTDMSIKSDTCTYSGIFMLDTGFGGTVNFSSKFSERNGLSNKLKEFGNAASTDGAGVSGETRLVTVPRTFFAGEALPLLPCQMDVNSSNSAYTNVFDGIIGYDILKRFNMIFDFNNSKLHIAPNFDFFSPFTFIKHQ